LNRGSPWLAVADALRSFSPAAIAEYLVRTPELVAKVNTNPEPLNPNPYRGTL